MRVTRLLWAAVLAAGVLSLPGLADPGIDMELNVPEAFAIGVEYKFTVDIEYGDSFEYGGKEGSAKVSLTPPEGQLEPGHFTVEYDPGTGDYDEQLTLEKDGAKLSGTMAFTFPEQTGSDTIDFRVTAHYEATASEPVVIPSGQYGLTVRVRNHSGDTLTTAQAQPEVLLALDVDLTELPAAMGTELEYEFDVPIANIHEDYRGKDGTARITVAGPEGFGVDDLTLKYHDGTEWNDLGLEDDTDADDTVTSELEFTFPNDDTDHIAFLATFDEDAPSGDYDVKIEVFLDNPGEKLTEAVGSTEVFPGFNVTLQPIDDIATVTGTPVIVPATVDYGDNSAVPDDVLVDARIDADSTFPDGTMIIKVVLNGTTLRDEPHEIGGQDAFYLSDILDDAPYQLNQLDEVSQEWEVWVVGVEDSETTEVTVTVVAYTGDKDDKRELDSDGFDSEFNEATLTKDESKTSAPFGGTLKFGITVTYPAIENLDERILTDARITSDKPFPAGTRIDWDYQAGTDNGRHVLQGETSEIYLSDIVEDDRTPLASHDGSTVNWTFEITGPGSGVYNLTIVPVAILNPEYPFIDEHGDEIELGIELTVGPLESTHEFGSGWQLLSVPAVGQDRTPDTVFASVVDKQALVIREWNGNYEEPGEIDPGRGYWVWLHAGQEIEVTGGAPVGDYDVELGAAGWHQISTPVWTVGIPAIRFVRDDAGTQEEKTFTEAISDGWLTAAVWRYEAKDQVYVPVSLLGSIGPWQGYWIHTKVEDLTMRLPLSEPYLEPPPPLVNELEGYAPPEGLTPPAPPSLSGQEAGLEVSARPNPLSQQGSIVFQAAGLPVEAVWVTVYDISGRPVFSAKEQGNQLTWDAMGPAGRPVANGVYLFSVRAEVAGEWLSTPADKLLIVR